MKKIIISGGSDGLGKALAAALTKSGHEVVILAPNKIKTESAAKEIGCAYQVCDISDWQQVDMAVQAANTELNGVNVLINNAGIYESGKLEDMSPDDIQRTFNVNVIGTLFLTKAVIPIMKSVKNGYIININSQSGLCANAERTLYSGSKWALTGITKVLQAELATSGIKVSGIYPGAMEQTMLNLGQRDHRTNGLPYQDMIDAAEFILSRGNKTVITDLGMRDNDN